MGNITLKQVTKNFDGHEVIKPLDLSIDNGEFVVFVGPSGCGKSTMLRMIAGLEDVSSGTIEIDGQDATETPPAKRGLAMVFQSYALYPHMSVRSNIAFPLKRAKMDESLIEAAEDLGCSKLAAFWLVTWPLSRNGIIAGCFLVFIPAIGEFVIPSLLGGSGTLMIGKVLFEEFFSNRDWPVASAVAVILLLILIIPIILFQRNEQKAREAEG